MFIAAELPMIHRINLPPSVVQQWIEIGKLNRKPDEMRSALGTLCLWDLMSLP